MSFFLSCFTGKRKKSPQYYSSEKQQLPRAKSLIKQNGQVQKYDTSKVSHIKKIKLPKSNSKISVVRNQDYSQVSNIATGLKIYLTDDDLNFKMDYEDGISHNLTINTFHYEAKNEEPGYLYYQNVGLNGLGEKQETKKQQKYQEKMSDNFKEIKNEEMPTQF